MIALEDGLKQVMWPDHCVQGTHGAEFHANLVRDEAKDVVVQKGMHSHIDSYSAFFDNNKQHKTELDDILKKHGITEVYIGGLALVCCIVRSVCIRHAILLTRALSIQRHDDAQQDYCVQYSARDAAELGYKTFVIEDASRGIAQDTISECKTLMDNAGVKLIKSADIQ